MTALRDYQVKALSDVRQAVGEGVRRIVLQMPTGAGKTEIAAAIVNGAQGKRKRVIFEVPAISLVDQTLDKFDAAGITEVGVIQANHQMTDWSKPIQIASVQTLQRRDKIPEADVVIRDECHQVFKFDVRWMLEEAWRKIPFIGLSATPWTKGLGTIYERLVIGTTTQELIDHEWLVPFKVFAPSHPDLKGVRTVAGDYAEGELSERLRMDKRLTADIVQTWKDKAQGRPTICFAVDRLHAKTLQESFIANGVPAGYVDCETPLSERRVTQRMFEDGAIKVVCNVDIIGVGVDWPMIECISYCRPTKSHIRFVQNIGRGLRTAVGKSDLLILDHSDTSLRLGFVTDINRVELHTGKLAPAAPAPTVRLPKECSRCGYLRQYGVRLCPNCGHEAVAVSRVEPRKGELTEFDGKKVKATMAEKQHFLAELKAYYLLHPHYKPGWVSAKYREKFEVWPVGAIRDVKPAGIISDQTLRWIKKENIRWFNSHKRAAQAAE